MSALLHGKNIVKSFDGRSILNIGELSVEPGARLSLVGGNGCGKTTLLKVIAGLFPADSPIEWSFNNGNTLQRGRGGIMLAHQTPYMFSTSVRSNVALVNVGDDEVQSALTWAGLSEVANEPAPKLSGGMQQRVSLARIYAARPVLCLLDEPLAHLDEDGIELVSSLSDYLQDGNNAIITAAPQQQAQNGWRLQDGDLQPLGGMLLASNNFTNYESTLPPAEQSM